MKKRSSSKVTKRLFIDEIVNDEALISIYDLSSEKEIKQEDEQGNVSITYEYDAVEMKVVNNESYINNHIDELYEKGKYAEEHKVVDVSIQARLEALEEAVLELAGE